MRARLLLLGALVLAAIAFVVWKGGRGDDGPWDEAPAKPVEGASLPDAPTTRPTLAAHGAVAPPPPAPGAAPAPRATGTLLVRVVDLGDRPITTPVSVEVGEARSGGWRKSAPDESNVYRFEDVKPGEWEVTVFSPDFIQTRATVVVEAGAVRETTVRLDPGASVEGVVVDDDGKPVPSATVEVGAVAGNEKGEPLDVLTWTRRGTADAEGRFAVRGLAAVESFVAARGPFGADSLKWKTLRWLRTPLPAAGLRLVMSRLGAATMRVLLPDGKPFSGTAGVFITQSGASSGAGREVTEGAVRWEGLAPGTIAVEVDVEGFAPLRRRFEGRLAADVDLGDATVEPGVAVVGRVTDLAGAPVADAYVWSTANAGVVETETDGTFRIKHALAGAARLSADAVGFIAAEKAIDVGRTATPTEIRLGRGARIRLLVKDAAGVPKGGVPLVAIELGAGDEPAPGGRVRWERTDETGSSRLQLAPGRWRLSWRRPNEEQVPFGAFTFTEGQVLDLPLSLPK